ncbi:MAG: alpha/beta fold hydrolase [Propionibacteriaceae bacterium]|jgi:dienelactone hydrolase|nr:alpha/beta fold hydrolase [Propionibacteriaceae bacterium]
MTEVLLHTAGAIVVGLVIFSLVSWLLCRRGFDRRFGRSDTASGHSWRPRLEDYPDLGREAVSFDSRGNTLKGYLFGPLDGAALVVVVHRMGGAAEQLLPVIDWLVGLDYQVLAFDCTGCHNSGGAGTRSAAQAAIDLDAALDWARRQPQFARLPVLLYGHSWGGHAVASILRRRPDVAGVVAVAGFNHPARIANQSQKDAMGFFATIEYPFFWLETRRRAGAAASSAVDGLNTGAVPALIVQGARDPVVTPAVSIYAQQRRITNPQTQFLWRDQPGRDDHINLVCSAQAVAYQREIVESLARDRTANFSRQGRDDFWERVDRRRANQLDSAFTAVVQDFFAQALDHAAKR